jgi:hypothetical protein
MKKYFLISCILTILFTTFSFSGIGVGVDHVSAQASVSGDEVCGGINTPRCTISDAKAIFKNLIINVVVPIGSALLVVFIIFRLLMAQKALMEGNAQAYKEAGKKIGNAIFGFFIVVAVVGGLLLAMLKFLSVDPRFLQLLSDAVIGAFIPHAYAQYLPNPLGTNNLYDFILTVVRTVIRFFVYPAIIAVWVWTGFAFVAAQGAPEALMKAKKWLMWAIICTVLIFMTEAFLFALRGTVNQILPNSATTAGVGTGGTPYVPPTGTSGTASVCAGRPAGSQCSTVFIPSGRIGLCGNDENGIYGCYVGTVGDTCLLSDGITSGKIANDYQCYQPPRSLVGRGGSCRISAECQSGSCVSAVCQ